jgi:glutamine amidotransferase
MLILSAILQVYKGSDEILLSKLVLDPAHSILKQSFDSRLRLVSRPLPP